MTKLNAFGIALMLGCVAPVAFPAAAAADPPVITTRWEETDLDFEGCKKRIPELLREGGFRNPQVLPTSVYGTRGNYAATVRCVRDKGIIYFTVAGPDGKLTERYTDQMADKL